MIKIMSELRIENGSERDLRSCEVTQHYKYIKPRKNSEAATGFEPMTSAIQKNIKSRSGYAPPPSLFVCLFVCLFVIVVLVPIVPAVVVLFVPSTLSWFGNR